MIILFLLIAIIIVALCVNTHKEENNTRIFPDTSISNKTNYLEILDDPRWEQKREEILKRDNHECQWCHKTTTYKNPLQIHHKYYIMHNGKFRQPWDYPDKALITLCKNCHEFAHKNRKPPVIFK